MRACIGRSFALQEATLVLAMLLQRFEIWRPAPYELKIKETLTLKPDGLQLRARVRQAGGARSLDAAGPAAGTDHDAGGQGAVPTARRCWCSTAPTPAPPRPSAAASPATARRAAGRPAWRRSTIYAGRLPKEGAVVIVTSSYNGQPPDNARAFVAWAGNVPAGALVGVRYAVFGCGNRDWGSTYQAVPQLLDERLAHAGAQPLVARGEADARGDFFGDFERWYVPLWGALAEALGVSSVTVAEGPLYVVETVASAGSELIKQNKLDLATVVENRELVDMSSPLGRSKRHLEFALPPGATYAAGDYLAVLPENHPDLVERAARRFGLRGDAAVVLHSTRGAMAASLPTDRPVSVQELLGRHVELSAPATRKDVERLAARTSCPPHQVELAALAAEAERYQAEILDKRVSVLDLLERYPACELGFAEALELLPAMRVRQYSISSSPRQDPGRCTLTVAVVGGPARSGSGQFHGTCSSFLARLQPGDRLAVAVRTPHNPFHPPASNATPTVMICAGTGLAPFRGFVQERALRKVQGEPTGPSLLFFGCDHPEVDFLYRDELAHWEKAGVVTVLPAFFRQPEGEVNFVQHRLWKEREQVRTLIDDGATVFICGDGQRMAPAARETLARIHQERAGCSDAEAAAWLEELERRGRFVADVFA